MKPLLIYLFSYSFTLFYTNFISVQEETGTWKSLLDHLLVNAVYYLSKQTPRVLTQPWSCNCTFSISRNENNTRNEYVNKKINFLCSIAYVELSSL